MLSDTKEDDIFKNIFSIPNNVFSTMPRILKDSVSVIFSGVSNSDTSDLMIISFIVIYIFFIVY